MLRSIYDVAEDLGVEARHVIPHGRAKAKIDLAALEGRERRGRLVLVSAITPTKAGEGKTTVSVGLAMGLTRLGKRAVVCVREPSLGPVFGIKGGGTGGGAAQVEPAADINLHFTGDIHAVSSAHNLLAALVDNHLHFGGSLGLDPRRVDWRRVVDMNDRALRSIVIGLGGPAQGVPRESGFDITAASEVMAILGLARDLDDLRTRLGRVVVGATSGQSPITAADLQAEGAMAALLREALMPNLVQTREGSPAIVHGGPFANIAHGCSSVVATDLGLRHAEIVVTEAGFGFDLGGEKFLHIKGRQAGLWPDAVVLVATLRALKVHGGASPSETATTNMDALRGGLANLDHQLGAARHLGLHPVVAINVFADDRDDELEAVRAHCERAGITSVATRGFAEGGAGAEALSRAVLAALEEPPSPPRYLYDLSAPYREKLEAIARTMYGADGVQLAPVAERSFRRLEEQGVHLPVCVAKTPLSLTDVPSRVGRPTGFTIHVREARLSAGAGFVVALLGDVMTMPGLPRRPAAADVRIEDGVVRGLMHD